MSPKQRKELLAGLLELTGACPFDRCNPEDCPLSALRGLSRPQRVRWLRALPEDDLVYLATYHYTCLGAKLASAPRP